jgi:23S rRNA (pseudouridine1915-N3)-methyltransferase
MRIHCIAVGERMPPWVAEGYQEYARRLPKECSLNLVEIPAAKRGKHVDVSRIRAAESERVLAAVPPRAYPLVLDASGCQWSTEELAERLRTWMASGDDIALLVGGPDGHSPLCLHRARAVWSLSRLTLPHMLVRVIVAEQIYRAWTLLAHHPYHR